MRAADVRVDLLICQNSAVPDPVAAAVVGSPHDVGDRNVALAQVRTAAADGVAHCNSLSDQNQSQQINRAQNFVPFRPYPHIHYNYPDRDSVLLN